MIGKYDRWADGQEDRYSRQMRDRQIDMMNGQTDMINGQTDIQD